jgi:hypothetical protein
MSNSDAPLPEIVAEIAAVAGADAAWAIVRARGGQQVFIPARAREDHWLPALVGMDAARKICDHFRVNDRGSQLLIPMAAAAQRSQRWTEALASDASVDELAATMGVHRRTVFRHRRGGEQDDPDQGNLPL